MPSWIFIDTEFTNLAPEAELISFAAVADDGREFYCEIAPTPGPTSEFVRRHVLPLLEGGAAACPRAGFAQRLAAWLAGFDDPVLTVRLARDIRHLTPQAAAALGAVLDGLPKGRR